MLPSDVVRTDREYAGAVDEPDIRMALQCPIPARARIWLCNAKSRTRSGSPRRSAERSVCDG